MYHGEHGEHEEHHNQGFNNTESTPLTKLNAALSLAKAMPPSKLKKNLIGLVNLAPEIEDNLLEKIQLPMEIDNSDPNFVFLKTEFNREGNSYRNPYTNHYSPENSEGYKPSGHFRALQQSGAILFAQYVKQYYGGDTIGNFFVTETEGDANAFSCGFFAKKISKQEDGYEGNWDSFNIVDVTFDGQIHHYHLSTTILIQMDINNKGINLTGFLKKNKQEKRNYKGVSHNELNDHHLATIGEMIEDMETMMRQHLQAIYVAKSKEIIFTTRYENTIGMEKHRMNLANDLKKLRFGSGSE